MRPTPDIVSSLARSYLLEDLDRNEVATLAASATIRRLVPGDRPGEFELKGIPGSWRLWRLERDGADPRL